MDNTLADVPLLGDEIMTAAPITQITPTKGARKNAPKKGPATPPNVKPAERSVPADLPTTPVAAPESNAPADASPLDSVADLFEIVPDLMGASKRLVRTVKQVIPVSDRVIVIGVAVLTGFAAFAALKQEGD